MSNQYSPNRRQVLRAGLASLLAPATRAGTRPPNVIFFLTDDHGSWAANCYGCSGRTASGQHAGHGIVAVDPSVIPLGSHLYIPGYGQAIAGDTGGAIHGNRVDLGFNNAADAMQFGRRAVTVYVLHP